MPSTVKRQSAAVMFTDIAGYTTIMASDEEKALSLLQEKRQVLKPLIDKHDGIYVKGTGDGTLSYFDSAYKASKCAKLFQESIYDNENMNVRVGIHVGDIVLDDGDVYGDGVNVASRLESMSPVGGICVSNTVYDELRNKKEFDGVELGLQSLKGVGRLVEIYGLKGDLLTEPKLSDYQDNKIAIHSDDEVPSIAIIPFRNKGQAGDAFYAYGICADLVSDCSSAGLIRVASLERIEELGDVSIEQKANELNVRYVSTGTLWKIDNIFQLSIELYDTKEAKVIWSDRWQENWDNLINIKGKLSDGLLKSLNKKPLKTNNMETTNTEAYEYYLKGKYKMWDSRKNLEDIEVARGLLQKSIDLDNNLVLAKNDIGWSYAVENNLDKAMEIFKSSLKQCEKIGDIREIGHSGLGYVYRCKGDFKNSVYHTKRSITIDEKLGNLEWVAKAQREMAVHYAQVGDFDKSFDYIKQSIEINKKLGEEIGLSLDFHVASLLYFWIGKIDRAWEYASRSLEICEKFDSHGWVIFLPLFDLGLYNLDKKKYDKAIEYFEKSIYIIKRVAWKGDGLLVWATTLLYLSYKKIGKKYDKSLLLPLIKENEHLEEDIYFKLYQLFEDTTYLETAYNQTQEKADNLEPDVAAKFLSYPIPKAIVEEWEKVK